MAKQLRNVRGGTLRTKDKVDKRADILVPRAFIDTVASFHGWRPIETAPKDGTEILVAGTYVLLAADEQHFVDMSRWVNERWDGFSSTYYRVTHWMPKPDPPPRESAEAHPRK